MNWDESTMCTFVFWTYNQSSQIQSNTFQNSHPPEELLYSCIIFHRLAFIRHVHCLVVTYFWIVIYFQNAERRLEELFGCGSRWKQHEFSLAIIYKTIIRSYLFIIDHTLKLRIQTLKQEHKSRVAISLKLGLKSILKYKNLMLKILDFIYQITENVRIIILLIFGVSKIIWSKRQMFPYEHWFTHTQTHSLHDFMRIIGLIRVTNASFSAVAASENTYIFLLFV